MTKIWEFWLKSQQTKFTIGMKATPTHRASELFPALVDKTRLITPVGYSGVSDEINNGDQTAQRLRVVFNRPRASSIIHHHIV